MGRWSSVDALAAHPNQIDKSPYAYAWNNPVTLNDPDGNCPTCPTALGGAIIGGVLGAGISIYNQWGSEAGISLSKVAAATGAGIASGAIIGSGAGLVAAGAGGGAASTGGLYILGGTGVAASLAGDVIEQGAEVAMGERASLDGEEIATNAMIAGPVNMVAGLAGNAVKGKVTEAVKNTVFGNVSHKTVTASQKAAKKKLKTSGNSYTKSQMASTKKAAKSSARTAHQNKIDATTNNVMFSTTMSAKKAGNEARKEEK